MILFCIYDKWKLLLLLYNSLDRVHMYAYLHFTKIFIAYVWSCFAFRPKNKLFACPHPTDPDFENLKKVFFFYLLYKRILTLFLEIPEKVFFLLLQFLNTEMSKRLCVEVCVLEVCV